VPLEHRVGVTGQGAGAPEEEGDDRERRDEDEGEVGPGWARPGTDPLDDEGHQRDGDQHDDDGIRGVGHRDEDHAHDDEHHGSSDRGPPPGAGDALRGELAQLPARDEAQRAEQAQVVQPAAR
jgi:hypothetical protein